MIAAVIGLAYTLLLLGPARLDPTNVSWLNGDAATYYIGWELFRQDAQIHWPLTWTSRLGHPLGESVAFLDVNPLLATLFKAFSPFLPTPFQYLGFSAVLAISLQFFFAARLFYALRGPGISAVLLPALFFLIAPPMTWRLSNHYALVHHWLLVAALCVVVALQRHANGDIRRLALNGALLGGVAAGINAYLAFMVVVLVTAGVATAWWRQRLSAKAGAFILAATCVACVVFALALGLLRHDGGYRAEGYREYSMNLLAPIDPRVAPGIIYGPMRLYTPRQYEGYGYLGAGVLMLGVMLLTSCTPRRLRQLRMTEAVPIAIACVILTAGALSTRITAGPVLLVDLDPHQVLTKYLAPLRASGRLFWAPYYVILTAVLATALATWRPRRAAILLALALVVQVADTMPLRRAVSQAVHSAHSLPLHAPQWSSLGRHYANLLVFPPWQCSAGRNSPGGSEGFRVFGMLAVAQHMTTNSYYGSRYSRASLAFHCHRSLNELLEHPLSADSVYVVTPTVARTIANGPSGPDACHTLDGFLVCSSKNELGLPAAPVSEIPVMYPSGRIESWRDAEERGYLIGDWQPPEPHGAWSKGSGALTFRLTEDQRRRYRVIGLRLMMPVGAQGARYQIKSGAQERSGAFAGRATPRVETFDIKIPLQDSADGIQRIVLITHDAVRPVDIGLNSDGRVLGIAVLNATLLP